MTINLVNVDPRDYLSTADHQLTNDGHYAAFVAQLRVNPPRDLTELLTRLPDDVYIKLWEVPDAKNDQA